LPVHQAKASVPKSVPRGSRWSSGRCDWTAGDRLEDIVDEGVHDAHGLACWRCQGLAVPA